MNPAPLYDESPIERMLGLIERHAPKLMRAGGGPLSRDTPPITEVTPELIERVLSRIEEGKSYAQIGRELGITSNLARTITVRNRAKATDGRVTRHKS